MKWPSKKKSANLSRKDLSFRRVSFKVADIVHDVTSGRYQWYPTKWLKYPTILFGKVEPYWWPDHDPLPSPLSEHNLKAERITCLYRLSDHRIIQFLEIV